MLVTMLVQIETGRVRIEPRIPVFCDMSFHSTRSELLTHLAGDPPETFHKARNMSMFVLQRGNLHGVP